MTVFVRLSYPCFVSLLIVPHLGISFYTPINLVLSDQQSHLQLMRFTSLHKLGDRCLLATGWTNAIVFFVLLRYTASDYPFGIFKLFFLLKACRLACATGAWGMNFVSSSPFSLLPPLFSKFSYKSFLFQNFQMNKKRMIMNILKKEWFIWKFWKKGGGSREKGGGGNEIHAPCACGLCKTIKFMRGIIMKIFDLSVYSAWGPTFT